MDPLTGISDTYIYRGRIKPFQDVDSPYYQIVLQPDTSPVGMINLDHACTRNQALALKTQVSAQSRASKIGAVLVLIRKKAEDI